MDLDPAFLKPSGALLAAHIAVGAAIDREAVAETEHDPTTLDLLLRIGLAKGQRLRAVELCRQLLLSPSHISRMIDRAEKLGLAERTPDPDDRRAHLVQLTPEGQEAVADFAPRLNAVLQRVFYDTLSAKEREQFTEYLRRVERAARVALPSGPAAST